MATTKAYELGQLGGTLDVDSASNITLSGNLDAKYSGFDSDFTAKSTSDLSEGSNLYYTDARADARIASATTADLTEGSNLYYTTSRSDSDTGVYISGDRSYGNITTTGYIRGPSTFYIDPAPVDSDAGLLVIRGDLQVDGTTTTVNSTTVSINDKNIILADSAANAAEADGAGITINGASATITYDAVDDEWDFNKQINIPGGATTGDVSFGDNNKATFGAGSDLQIYHDGSNSFINDVGTGNLRIGADTNVSITNSTNSTNYAVFNDASAVKLYYGGAKKFETTSSGINVSGNILRMDGTSPMMYFMETGVADSNHRIRQNAGNLYFQKLSDDTNTATTRMVIDGGTGDVIFYDTSGNAKMSWDASAESLQLGGTTNIQHQGSNVTTFGNNFVLDSGYKYLTSGAANMLYFDAAGNTMFFKASSGTAGNAVSFSETMRISSDGNVGVGTTNPQLGSSWNKVLHVHSSGGVGSHIRFTDTTSGETGESGLYIGQYGNDSYLINRESGFMALRVNGTTDAIRITSGGNVGIGTTSPSLSAGYTTLAISGSSNSGWIQLMNGGTSVADWYSSGGVENTFRSLSGGFNFTVSGSSPIRYVINSQERMRIDSNGNVGIGTTNPTNPLHVDGTSRFLDTAYFSSNLTFARWAEGSGSGGVNIKGNSGTHVAIASNHSEGYANLYLNRIDVSSDITSNNNRFIDFYYDGVSAVRVRGNSSNDLSIDMHGGGDLFLPASGNFTYGKTSSSVNTDPGVEFRNGDHIYVTRNSSTSAPIWAHQLASTGPAIIFRQGSASSTNTVGSVTVTSTGATYNTTSDRRIKDNITTITDGKEKLLAMNPVTHTWKADPDAPSVHGFIAQEMQEVIPEAVSGDAESDDMMSMDYGRITPVIVAALQDALKEIEQLKTRINELEAK